MLLQCSPAFLFKRLRRLLRRTPLPAGCTPGRPSQDAVSGNGAGRKGCMQDALFSWPFAFQGCGFSRLTALWRAALRRAVETAGMPAGLLICVTVLTPYGSNDAHKSVLKSPVWWGSQARHTSLVRGDSATPSDPSASPAISRLCHSSPPSPSCLPSPLPCLPSPPPSLPLLSSSHETSPSYPLLPSPGPAPDSFTAFWNPRAVPLILVGNPVLGGSDSWR